MKQAGRRIIDPLGEISGGSGNPEGPHFVLFAISVVMIGHVIGAGARCVHNLSTAVIGRCDGFAIGAGAGPEQACCRVIGGIIFIAGGLARVIRGGHKLAG